MTSARRIRRRKRNTRLERCDQPGVTLSRREARIAVSVRPEFRALVSDGTFLSRSNSAHS